MSDRYAARRERLLPILREAEVDALLVSGEINVRYLTGFTGDSSFLLYGAGVELLITDGRYTTQLQEECPGLELDVRPVSEKLHEATARVLKASRRSRIGIEGQRMVVETFQYLQEQLPEVALTAVNGRIEKDLRAIKDKDEIAETRAAVRLAEKAFELMRASLTVETTEREAAWELERGVRKFGGEGLSFPPIVAVGDRAALPHYRPHPIRVKEAPLLLVDWGAQPYSGYKSDLTRTLFPGPPQKKMARVYEIVLAAQLRAIRSIRPGRKCSAIDRRARDYIDQAGYGRFFGHGLGHGIGLEIHEQPRFSPSDDSELKPGMIVTVEPGIYLPGVGGVRIEDDVLVTEEGCEVLSTLPKDFEAMRIG
jgi:Xaa-Pro aminopeptidase